MGSVYFLDAVADQRSGHTWLCFPADTSPPEIHSILRHASNKTKPLGLQLRSAAYGTLKPEERRFRTLTVRTASASETPFEFDIEGQREYELHFDPSSDTLCLNFKLSHDHQFVSDPNFSDTASSIISSKTSKSKSRIEELDQHQVYCRYRWHLRSFQSNLGLQVGIHTTDTDRSGPEPSSQSSQTLRVSQNISRSPSPAMSQAPSRQRARSRRRSSRSMSAFNTNHSLSAAPSSATNSGRVSSHSSDVKTPIQDILGDLRHVAIRWDPSVFSAYECTQCLHSYNTNASESAEEEEEDDGKIPAICWRGGTDPWPSHDFKPVVPRDILEYWPVQFPNVERVFIIVEDNDGSAMARVRSGGAEMFDGALERFYVINEPTLGRRWDVPASFAKEMEKNFSEMAVAHGTFQPPPRCSVLARVGYAA